METIRDIVSSGKPWKMVLYGSSLETRLAEQTEEPFATFWRDKEAVPYQEFPYKTVRGWKSLFEQEMVAICTGK